MIQNLFRKYGKRRVLAVLAIVLILIGIGIRMKGASTPIEITEVKKSHVMVRTVGDLASESSFAVVGTVSAVSEAQLQTEASGRVTSVSVGIGDTVFAGGIIASIENSAERAQLLQAEGAYESALAGSLQSGASLEESKIGVRNAYRDTFTTTDNAVRTTVDQFYAKQQGLKRFGIRLTGTKRSTTLLIDDRMEIELMLTKWTEHVTNNFVGITEETMLADAEATISAVSNLTAELAYAVLDKENDYRYTDAEEAAYAGELNGARASLDGALETISRARSTFEQAQLSGDRAQASQSNAQLKSALGTLRSAQANYEKTLVRTPITGVVNALYLKAGEYVSSGQPAVLVANNGSLEISTALGEDDIETIHIGDSVLINDTSVGTIIKFAPAVDPLSGKVEVKISVADSGTLKNGSTVSITFVRNTAKEDEGKITVPLSALKLLPSGTIAFGVDSEHKLIAYPVTIGAVLGESVEILEGLTRDTEIIEDARGLKVGDSVEVISN